MSGRAYELKDLFWEVTKRCNARCSFCGSSCGLQAAEGELTTEEIIRVFREIAQDTDASRIMINITGGEPLMRQDLFDVMSECVRLGFRWGMVSNGMLITPEVIGRMKAAGMKTISVSLDGLQETHERLRGVPGSFGRVLAALRLLREADFLEHIQVTTVINRQNIGELEALRELLLPLGLNSWRVAIVDGIGRASGKDELLLGPDELRRYLDFIHAHSGDAELPVETSCSHFLGYRDETLGRPPFRCRTGVSVGSILANGDIFVCPNVPREPSLIQGNVRRDRFMKVWREGFAPFRDPELRRGKACADCPDWPACRGDSMHTWDFAAQEPGFCWRRYFPQEPEKRLTLEDAKARLKARCGTLRGVWVRYDGPAQRRPLVFTPTATRELTELFRWGSWHPAALSEQMGCLIGHELADCTLVEFVSPVYLELRSTTQATFSRRSWQAAQQELESINRSILAERCRDFRLFGTHCSLLGFVHSHPAHLPLNPSEPDEVFQRELARRGLQWSVIVNPQTKRLAALFGETMTLADTLLITEPEHSVSISPT